MQLRFMGFPLVKKILDFLKSQRKKSGKPTNLIGDSQAVSRRHFITRFHQLAGQAAVNHLREFQIATENLREEAPTPPQQLPINSAEEIRPTTLRYERPSVPRPR